MKIIFFLGTLTLIGIQNVVFATDRDDKDTQKRSAPVQYDSGSQCEIGKETLSFALKTIADLEEKIKKTGDSFFRECNATKNFLIDNKNISTEEVTEKFNNFIETFTKATDNRLAFCKELHEKTGQFNDTLFDIAHLLTAFDGVNKIACDILKSKEDLSSSTSEPPSAPPAAPLNPQYNYVERTVRQSDDNARKKHASNEAVEAFQRHLAQAEAALASGFYFGMYEINLKNNIQEGKEKLTKYNNLKSNNVKQKKDLEKEFEGIQDFIETIYNVCEYNDDRSIHHDEEKKEYRHH